MPYERNVELETHLQRHRERMGPMQAIDRAVYLLDRLAHGDHEAQAKADEAVRDARWAMQRFGYTIVWEPSSEEEG